MKHSTIALQLTQLDDSGLDTLVEMRDPVDKNSDWVCNGVRWLNVLFSYMGRKWIAQTLARVGLPRIRKRCSTRLAYISIIARYIGAEC